MADNMETWPKNMWPPQSPDLNPLDFSIWWHVESKACKIRHSNVNDLKTSVNKVWRSCASVRGLFVWGIPRLPRGRFEAKGGSNWSIIASVNMYHKP
ncbi:Uncharacterized protein FKW44_007738 [Caligus rogercresseyi]|uniref:Uncharacterized protein n=1 Tax=Caligus rogercresseyi TaxID=217165 RepID=A0A7T8KF58_CALRO|nr:Uncharacterized protein FKW44_007738 [Caligus rogercresseyi]